MAANSFASWDSGFPFQGIEAATTNDILKWDSGFTYQFTTSGAGTTGIKAFTKTVIANVKKWRGIVIANVKKWNTTTK